YFIPVVQYPLNRKFDQRFMGKNSYSTNDSQCRKTCIIIDKNRKRQKHRIRRYHQGDHHKKLGNASPLIIEHTAFIQVHGLGFPQRYKYNHMNGDPEIEDKSSQMDQEDFPSKINIGDGEDKAQAGNGDKQEVFPPD